MAGPVVAAAVILPPRFKHPWLIDSKKLSATRREAMVELIQKKAIAWSVAELGPTAIDEMNILRASFAAMNLAVSQLQCTPEHLLIDGNRFYPEHNIPYTCVIKGDTKVGSITAASILAKSYRDRLMLQLHEQHPHYGWDTNVGYPTTFHRNAIAEYGITQHHRKSFRLLPEQLELPL